MTFFFDHCLAVLYVSPSFSDTVKLEAETAHAYIQERGTVAGMARVAAEKLLSNLIVTLEDGSNQ